MAPATTRGPDAGHNAQTAQLLIGLRRMIELLSQLRNDVG